MRIAVVMSREPTYTRNKVILRGLKEAGLEVLEYSDNSRTYPARFARVMSRYIRNREVAPDAVLVGFLGQPLMPFVRMLTDRPIILDIFISGFDTMCCDRKRFTADSIPGRFFRWLDHEACEKADLILLDTNEHIDYFVEVFRVPREKFRRIFVGADTNLFWPREHLPRDDDALFRLFYYCTYHPVHGAEHVVRAAHNLRDEKDIRFTLIGAGQERERIDRLAAGLGLVNVDFLPWIDYLDLPQAIAESDVCLGGHFSTVDKASRVIPGKVYQFLAMRKPTIVGDNPANRELLTSGEDTLMVRMADPDDLADAILKLKNDPALRDRIANGGYRTFQEHCTPGIIGKQIAGLIREVLEKNSS